VIQGDHQNKPDIGAGLARQWFDSGVDLLIDVPIQRWRSPLPASRPRKNKAL